MTTDDLAEALLDVRRAYRLIYAYQSRISDVLRAIAGVMRQHSLPFDRWEPKHADVLPRPNKPFFDSGISAWSSLPMYATQAHWADAGVRKGVRRWVDVYVDADTGFESTEGDPNPSDFVQPEVATSQLIVRMMTVRGRGANWNQATEYVDQHGTDDGNQAFTIGAAQYTCSAIELDLTALAASDSLDRLVLKPMQRWAQEIYL